MKFKAVILSLLLVLISSFVEAKDYSLIVKDEKGEIVPFVHAVCPRTYQYVMTNEKGVLMFDDKDFKDTDIFIFNSMFYDELKILVKEIKLKKELVLTAKLIELDEVAVIGSNPHDYLISIVKEMAESFAENYAKDYVAKVSKFSTVECNGKYREFLAYQGLFASVDFTQEKELFSWDDKNWGSWAPLTVMRSNPYMASSDEILKANSEHLSPKSRINSLSVEALSVEYINSDQFRSLCAKRSLEMFSPLNQDQIPYYKYDIHKRYKRDGEDLLVIRFETIEKCYPKKTTIFGRGYIHYNQSTKCPEKIIMENHQDQKVMFPRKRIKGLSPSATQHLLEVNYTFHNGKIYGKNISLNINWVHPKGDGFIYRLVVQKRPNPIKNKLRDYRYTEFSDFILLDQEMKDKVIPQFKKDFMELYYFAEFDKEKWNNINMPGINREKLFKDLNIGGKTLYDQAKDNGFKFDYDWSNANTVSRQDRISYNKRAQEILYPLIYSK